MIDRVVLSGPGYLIEVTRRPENLFMVEQKWQQEPVSRLYLPWSVANEVRTALRILTTLDP